MSVEWCGQDIGNVLVSFEVVGARQNTATSLARSEVCLRPKRNGGDPAPSAGVEAVYAGIELEQT